jgi:ADP-ribosylglycohydrolase
MLDSLEGLATGDAFGEQFSQISAQDTVPFCLWVASRHLDDYEAALWETVSVLGDRDTTCAIVGGVVAARAGRTAIPDVWRRGREPLPPWVDEIRALARPRGGYPAHGRAEAAATMRGWSTG